MTAPNESKEVWRPVLGFEGRYEVSNFGNVRSLISGTPKPLRPDLISQGYLRVRLCVKGGCERRMIHRLVLESFVGARPDGCQACHNNGNRIDNRPENLRWDTQEANDRDRDIHGTRPRGERHGMSKISEDDVRQIRAEFGEKRGRDRAQVLADLYGVSMSHIYRIVNHSFWKHVG